MVEDPLMRIFVSRFYPRRSVLFAVLPLLSSKAVFAHERFIPHTFTAPLQEDFFQSLNRDMLNIGLRGIILIAMLMALWFLRRPLDDLIEPILLRNLPGRSRKLIRLLGCFVMDKPVEHPWFKAAGEWAVVFFLRCLALVLVFSATRHALVLPSYPLDSSTLLLFQFAQAALAIGILTQTLPPLCGAMIFGFFLYQLAAFDWKIALDMLPILLVAVVYMSLPWDAWKHVITTITPSQVRWIRIVLGLGFFVLGWMKIYNSYLTIGVADNFPAVMDDPLIKLFYIGTNVHYQRECWIVAFAMGEIVTGFLLMVGVFCRVWCMLMLFMFTKLMVVDFGWAELPHLYFMSIFLVLLFSNRLSGDFAWIEGRTAAAAWDGKMARALLIAVAIALFLSTLVVYPGLYVLTKIPNSSVFGDYASGIKGGT
jgi:hypothetical protein